MPQARPSLVLVTDIGPDPDDAKVLVIAATAHVGRRVALRAVICNGGGEPRARARLARCLLDTIGATDVPVGIGSAGTAREPEAYEYSLGGCAHVADEQLHDGAVLLRAVLNEAPPASLTFVLISSLRDMVDAIEADEELVRAKTRGVTIMGGIEPAADGATGARSWVPDSSQNNEFDRDAAGLAYGWCFRRGVPLTVVSRDAVPLLPMQLASSFALRTGCPVMEYLARAQFEGLEGLWRKLNTGALPARCTKQWYFETFCGIDAARFAQRGYESLDVDAPIVRYLHGYVKPYDVVALMTVLPCTAALFDGLGETLEMDGVTHRLLRSQQAMVAAEHVVELLRETYHHVSAITAAAGGDARADRKLNALRSRALFKQQPLPRHRPHRHSAHTTCDPTASSPFALRSRSPAALRPRSASMLRTNSLSSLRTGSPLRTSSPLARGRPTPAKSPREPRLSRREASNSSDHSSSSGSEDSPPSSSRSVGPSPAAAVPTVSSAAAALRGSAWAHDAWLGCEYADSASLPATLEATEAALRRSEELISRERQTVLSRAPAWRGRLACCVAVGLAALAMRQSWQWQCAVLTALCCACARYARSGGCGACAGRASAVVSATVSAAAGVCHSTYPAAPPRLCKRPSLPIEAALASFLEHTGGARGTGSPAALVSEAVSAFMPLPFSAERAAAAVEARSYGGAVHLGQLVRSQYEQLGMGVLASASRSLRARRSRTRFDALRASGEIPSSGTETPSDSPPSSPTAHGGRDGGVAPLCDAYVVSSASDDARAQAITLSRWVSAFVAREGRAPRIYLPAVCDDSSLTPAQVLAHTPVHLALTQRLLLLAGPRAMDDPSVVALCVAWEALGRSASEIDVQIVASSGADVRATVASIDAFHAADCCCDAPRGATAAAGSAPTGRTGAMAAAAATTSGSFTRRDSFRKRAMQTAIELVGFERTNHVVRGLLGQVVERAQADED